MKPHFLVLDGLRGAAALCVLVFHVSEPWVGSRDKNVMPHAFLALGFFLALSGFVVGHAYDVTVALSVAAAEGRS
jgi:peptidoglycan/LPS O-acetylase OafA/YrhL